MDGESEEVGLKEVEEEKEEEVVNALQEGKEEEEKEEIPGLRGLELKFNKLRSCDR